MLSRKLALLVEFSLISPRRPTGSACVPHAVHIAHSVKFSRDISYIRCQHTSHVGSIDLIYLIDLIDLTDCASSMRSMGASADVRRHNVRGPDMQSNRYDREHSRNPAFARPSRTHGVHRSGASSI